MLYPSVISVLVVLVVIVVHTLWFQHHWAPSKRGTCPRSPCTALRRAPTHPCEDTFRLACGAPGRRGEEGMRGKEEGLKEVGGGEGGMMQG